MKATTSVPLLPTPQDVLADPHWLNQMQERDFRALTPLIYAHINPYGLVHLDMQERIPFDSRPRD